MSQRDILGECIRNEIEGGTPTFAGILNRVRQIKLAAAESLALKMMGMKNVKFGGCLVMLNLADALLSGIRLSQIKE